MCNITHQSPASSAVFVFSQIGAAQNLVSCFQAWVETKQKISAFKNFGKNLGQSQTANQLQLASLQCGQEGISSHDNPIWKNRKYGELALFALFICGFVFFRRADEGDSRANMVRLECLLTDCLALTLAIWEVGLVPTIETFCSVPSHPPVPVLIQIMHLILFQGVFLFGWFFLQFSSCALSCSQVGVADVS